MRSGRYFKQEDLQFFKTNFNDLKGEGKLQFLLKNDENEGLMELQSTQISIDINDDLLEQLNNNNNIKFFLN